MKNNQNEPLLVQIPETGQFIDIRPFIYFITHEDSEPSIELGLAQTIDFIETHIKLLTTCVRIIDDGIGIERETDEMVDLFVTLHTLKDLAKNTVILNTSERGEK